MGVIGPKMLFIDITDLKDHLSVNRVRVGGKRGGVRGGSEEEVKKKLKKKINRVN